MDWNVITLVGSLRHILTEMSLNYTNMMAMSIHYLKSVCSHKKAIMASWSEPNVFIEVHFDVKLSCQLALSELEASNKRADNLKPTATALKAFVTKKLSTDHFYRRLQLALNNLQNGCSKGRLSMKKNCKA